jgi:hypothetical protein
MIWWHRHVLKHEIHRQYVSVALWDRWSQGNLYHCKCGKKWAK